MMQGLKSFHCATCLLKFGCMSANHQCPHCRKPFSYSPADYHRKITCSSSNKKKCNKSFGFYLHYMSDRALKNLREEIVQARDDMARTMMGLKRRAARAASRGEDEDVEELRAFAMGLADECPKCGVDFVDLLRDGISAEVHLMNCNDEVSHKNQKAKKDEKRKRNEARAEASAIQNDVESKAAWDFLGKNNDQLYLLSENQLKEEMKEKGLESSDGDDKADMISKLVTQERSLVVRDGSSSAAAGAGTNATSLPSMPTLQRMDAEELRSVLASHGMGGKKMKGMTKRQMLNLLEDKVYKNDDDDDDGVVEVKMLTNGGGKTDDCCGRKKPAKRRRKKKKIEMDSSSDDDDDGDWNPGA